MTTYTANNSVPMAALPTTSGVVQKFLATETNDGQSTFAPDSLAAAPIFGLGGQQLQGNEIVGGGIATLVSFIGPLLNSGDLCWVLLSCDGASQQVAPATQSDHAVQLQQLLSAVAGVSSGRLLRTTIYTLNGGVLQSSVNGAAFADASSTFTPLSNTMAVDVETLGGGGGGGAAAPTGANLVSGGCGGGGGGWAKAMFSTGFSGVTVAVGAGGVGATVAEAATSGGTSSFGTLMSASGGSAGTSGPAKSVSDAPNGVGPGGVGSSPGINAEGGNGEPAFYGASPVGGIGGFSMYGAGPITLGASAAGSDAVSYGAGGSGGTAVPNVSTGAPGGSGMSGLVIVREYS
jgi:hypothetical protein